MSRALPAAGFGLVASMIFGCQPAPPPPQRTTPEVTVTTPEVRTVTEDGYFTGKTASTDSVELRARVKGFLETADFKDGDFVKKGQVLFTIEQAPYKASLAAAEAKKQQAEARLKLAEANLVRADQLVGDKAITIEEYQTRQAERDAAKAEIAYDEAEIRQAKINLDYTVIHSPIAGRISRRQVDPGNLVGSSESTLLATVVGMDPMYVYFDVSEKVVMDLVRWIHEHGADSFGDKHDAYIQLPGEEGYPHKGHLDYLDPSVDPSTGTAVARAVFSNKDGLLYPGVYAEVRAPGRPIENAILIEQKAIGTDLDGKYVLVVKPDKIVERRRVTLGPEVGEQIVVFKGLKPDEQYVVVGLQKARPGQPVQPIEAPKRSPVTQPAAAPAPQPEPKPQPKPDPQPETPEMPAPAVPSRSGT